MAKATTTQILTTIKEWVLGKLADVWTLIPSQASSSNQLADKAFVNSSIATATATFRGTYNLVSDLSLTTSATQQQIAAALATKMTALSITPDTNDYTFVQVPTDDATPTEIERIDRYKYDGSAWEFEYALNNSGFTAEQWAAINSGVTSGDMTKLRALPTSAELTTLLNGKQDVIQDLADIRSGASAGATAVQPATLDSALSNTVAESGVFDLSAYNNGTKYADLNAALTALNALPDDYKKGGMSFKYVRSSDNKYVQYRLTADEFTTDTTQWAIADDGVYVENPEFVYVQTDKDDKILWAIKKDGDIYYGAGVPQQVIDYIEEKIANLSLDEYEDIVAFLNDLEKGDKTLQDLLNEKVDKEEGKSLIDAEYAEGVYHIENPEFVGVWLDNDEHILFGVQTDGNFLFGCGVPQQVKDYIEEKISSLSLDEYEDMVSFLSDYLGSDTTLKAIIDGINATVEDKLDKEGLDPDALNSIQAVDNPEYLQVTIDSENKILEGIKQDGTKLVGGNLEVGGSAKILGEMEVSGVSYKVIENSEYLAAWVDAEDKIIFGFKADGKTYVGAADFLNDIEDIKAFLQNIIDKTIDWDALSSITETEDFEFIEAKTDSEGKLLAGRTSDGAAFENVGFSTPKMSIDGHTIENIEDLEGRSEITTDSNNKIVSYRDAAGILHENAGLELSNPALSAFYEMLKNKGYAGTNDWSDSEFVELPIPTTCAIVNIGVNYQAEAKGVDIPTYIQFWDKNGNYFKKPIELNAQGSSSMNYHIKNQAVDFTDDSKIKFGNWVPCDSFHIKKYFIDVFRGQCIVGYRLTEQMYQTRLYGERRPWDYLNTFDDVDNSNGSFSKDYATGALAHPDGFPVKVYFNGKNAGIYAFCLKKDRANYYCKKDKQKQIILDGVLGAEFWRANGDLSQTGVVDPSQNLWHDFKIRNPKIAKDINGNKYDGDNPKEPSNDYATTKAAIERLTTAIDSVNAESTTADKKAKFAEFFNVPFLIDYELVSQVIYNHDGYQKNWIWITNDGNLWCPTSYDMDSIFGQHWNGASYVIDSITAILGASNNLPTGNNLLKGLYNTELEARYKELRDKKIFDVNNIVGLLEDWVNKCGYDNLKEDIEEIVTSPYIDNGSMAVDEEGMPILVPNTPSYRDGEKEYTYPPTTGGWYNSILRVRNWLVQRIQTLDSYYNYN